ncbi:MAG: signal peptidase I [Lachnospiraceae bacterium]|nr:signal peptidase I [Lachnospiraceae bacterium]
MKFDSLPSVEQLENELKREKRKKNYGRALRSTLFTLLVVAAAAILVVVLFLPVIQITGSSMSPTLKNGDIVVAANLRRYESGEIIAFYYNNNLMVKRVIGVGGDVVSIDSDGVVYLNGEMLRENYLTEKNAGVYDIEYPYIVPENTYFVVGDNRYMSIDSRVSSVGCIDESLVAGRLVLRLWPFTEFGLVK